MRLVDTQSASPVLVLEHAGRRIWTMDSVAFGSAAFAGDVIVTGSHGGASAGEYAVSFGVAALVCNDAGIGKNQAGTAGLRALDRHGVIGVAVGHLTARIGDGADAWESGVITFVNATGRRAGIHPHRSLRDELSTFALDGEA